MGGAPGAGGTATIEGGLDVTVMTDSGRAGGLGDGGSSADAGAVVPPCDQVKALVLAYKAAHPGNGGKDWDINAKTPGQLAADSAARQLLSLCGPDQRPVIPLIAWEYGGMDHQWINPDASALVYCVFVPVKNASANWLYDAAQDHVTADVYVKCPDQNPCKSEQGVNQVTACIGDMTNFEIFVDTASLNDGVDVGLNLANSSTELKLILPNGTKVHLFSNL
jgi:hypothetical protein